MGPEAPREEIAKMPTTKRILCPERLRRVPKAFSWVDHRLVRDRHISRCSHEALALYLFLVTVADAEGLSYYSDSSAGRLRGMDEASLVRARRELCRSGLIAYQAPLYQVLSLDTPQAVLPVHPRCSAASGGGETVSIGEVLRRAIGEGS